MSQATSLICLC